MTPEERIKAREPNTVLKTAQYLTAALDALDKLESRYRWHPISEIHEDHGPVVLINLHDLDIKLGSNLDLDFDESRWTHFSRIAPLSSEEADRLKGDLCSKP